MNIQAETSSRTTPRKKKRSVFPDLEKCFLFRGLFSLLSAAR